MPEPTSAVASADIASTCRILGALFYFSPANPVVASFCTLIEQDQLAHVWPFGTPEALADIQSMMRQDLDVSRLAQAYQMLFVGPEHLEAPPWGSVYLGEEGTLYGDSTIALRKFLQAENISLTLEHNEPEDHIGLLLWALAWLAEQEKSAAMAILLREHVLSWSGVYLLQFDRAAAHPFYKGVGNLAALTLDALQIACEVEMPSKSIG